MQAVVVDGIELPPHIGEGNGFALHGELSLIVSRVISLSGAARANAILSFSLLFRSASRDFCGLALNAPPPNLISISLFNFHKKISNRGFPRLRHHHSF